MKGCTLREPWATLIASGQKDLETRGKRTKYRGLVAVHAGLRWTEDEWVKAYHLRGCGADLPVSFDDAHWPLGRVLSIGELVDCRPLLDTVEDLQRATSKRISAAEIGGGIPGELVGGGVCDGSTGLQILNRWAWVLQNVVPIPEADRPIVRGHLHLFDLDPELDARLTAWHQEQLAAA